MSSDVLIEAKNKFDIALEHDTQEFLKRWQSYVDTYRKKGGPGSGHHGHAGRPGQVGGSAAGSGTGSLGDSVEFVDKLAYTGDVSVRGIDSNGNDVWVKAGYDFNNGVINKQQLSYETAKILGFDDIVPESKTIPATGSIPDQDADIYILTRHVPGKTMGKFLRDGDDASKIDVESARKLVVLDAITGNIDRNLGNYIISDSGKVFAIDNDSWTSMDPRDHFSTNAWLKFQTAGVEFDYPIADIKHAASTLYNSEKFRSLVNFSDTQTLGEMHIVRRLDFILSDAYETAYKEWLEHKGGPGSGHHGHSGLPGVHGGSKPSGGSSVISHKDYITSLSTESKDAIRFYTRNGYEDINAYLRGSNTNIYTPVHDIKTHVRIIDDAINNAPPITNATLYRAMAKSPAELGIEVGNIYTDKAYMSTTRDARYMYENLSELYTRVLIKIPKKIRHTTRGLYVETISNAPKEKEVLLHRNSRFKVLSIAKQGMYDVVTMELLPND